MKPQTQKVKNVKRWLLAAGLVAVTVPAFAQIGVSINLGSPGYYGQVNVGAAPPPQLVYTRPVVIRPVPQYIGVAPIYLRVPPGYVRDWWDHCAEYRACDRPVYFVRNDWYLNRYVPYYREHDGYQDYQSGQDHQGRQDSHECQGGQDQQNSQGNQNCQGNQGD